jgi:hypothetical protein
LQLIEIIQLTLLIIITLGVIIIIFSYLGYRTKSKVNEISKPKIEERKLEQPNSDVPAKSIKNSESIKQQVPIKPNSRFEVFKPTLEEDSHYKSNDLKSNKIHSPRTLFIKK